MKHILTATVLALGLIAVTADSVRAAGWGPGYFNFGINISGQWGPGAPGGCAPGGYCPPTMYGAWPYAPAYGLASNGYGSPYELAGYGSPYGYGQSSAYGYGYGYGAQQGQGFAGHGASGAVAGQSAAPATNSTSYYYAPQGYGY